MEQVCAPDTNELMTGKLHLCNEAANKAMILTGGNHGAESKRSGSSGIGTGADADREENAQRDRKRQHPLPDRHARDDLIDPVRGALRHAPRAARGAKPASLAGKGDQLLMVALPAAQSEKPVREDAAFEKGIELGFDKLG